MTDDFWGMGGGGWRETGTEREESEGFQDCVCVHVCGCGGEQVIE